MKSPVLVALLLGVMVGRAESSNLVVNGSFANDRLHPGVPDFWQATGNPAIHQELRRDTGRDGGYSARLDCTQFAGDGGDYHVMLCQMGTVSVRRGQWYRLTFWAKAANLKAGAIELGLSNTRDWQGVGLAEAFTPGTQWEPFEFRFQARRDLPAADSRLQFYHRNTGTFWLADVALVETNEGREWFPQIATAGVKNFIPNSSFECGGANWGSYTYGLPGWAGNLDRLEGGVDATAAEHGQHSLKIALNAATEPVYHFDYYEPVRQPVRRVLAANRGWFHIQPGEPLTLSAWLRTDADAVIAQMAVIEAPEQVQHHPVTVTTRWQRCEFSFTPTQPFLFIAVGLDLEESKRDAATLWVDAVQLERGPRATDYEPRTPVESFLATDFPGNLFTNVTAGLRFRLRAFNNSDRSQNLTGKLAVTDFFDQTAYENRPTLLLPPHVGATLTLSNIVRGRRGFFRAKWTTPSDTQTLRCAVVTDEQLDSPFGFNHVYPWDFLVERAGKAGIHWWRDWSAQWQLVEPEPGQFDFRRSDEQINRVLSRANGRVDVLLPFPSAAWSTSARPEAVAKAAGDNRELRTRLPLAYAPRNLADFGHFAAEVVRHYPRHAVFQVLNEPVYTDYALPRQFGYTVDDYVRLLEVATRAMKAARPDCRIVGGLSAGVQAGWTRDFVTKGGLQFLDVFDFHIYDPAHPIAVDEASFSELENLMRAQGGPKPFWVTEWGCYADDDPACLPQTTGDETMNRCRWKSERAAAEHIVKFATVALAHGGEKFFFHAGTCGTINGPDSASVLFAYGGEPRKNFATVAAWARLVGAGEHAQKLAVEGLDAYVVRTPRENAGGNAVAIAWVDGGTTRPMALGSSVTGYDLMGNELPRGKVTLGETPIYLTAPQVRAIVWGLKDR
ncbi:MAG: carbohydrate binding domain-containing protein [Verrucomicrobiota bacterium]|jgi:hypothetical protein